LIFARSGILRKTPYCVTLQAVDQTVQFSPHHNQPTGGDTATVANASICLTTNLNRIHEYDMPRPEALTGSGHEYAPPPAPAQPSYIEGSGFRGEPRQGRSRGGKSKKEAYSPKIVYPKEATVYDTSRKFARIAEPESFEQLVQENRADLNFRLTSNPLNAFGITKIAGIVYLKNETAFQNKPESRHEITIAWKNYTAKIMVRLRKNPDEVHCAAVGPVATDSAEDFCAVHPNRTSCEGACGLGSLKGPCEYRTTKLQFGMWTEDYPTCSSGLDRCPDGLCDPLEEMGHREKIHICPQDCVFNKDIVGLHHSDKPRGIQTASGHCSCRASGHCSCIDTLRIQPSNKRNKAITSTSSSSTTTTTTTTVMPSIIASVSVSDVELFPVGDKNGTDGGKAPESEGTRRDPHDRSDDAPPAAVRDGGSFYEPGLISGPNASIYLIAIVLIPMVVAVMIVLYCFSRKLSVKSKLLDGSVGNGTVGGMNSISMNLVSNDTEIFNVELPLTSRINEINFKIDVKTDCAKMAICKEEQDRLESLWTPPQYETVDTASAELTGRYQTPSAMAVAAVISELSEDKKQLLLQSYDTPRPLIETATIEQKLRYENDVRLRPKKLSNNASGSSSPGSNEDQQHRFCINAIRSSSISPPRCLRNHFEETSFITRNASKADRAGDTASSSSSSGSSSGGGGCCNGEYDSPSRQPRRVVSYVDMNKNNRQLNANLEINHMIDKKQSKDIALRFSNVDNELQMVLVDPISQSGVSTCPQNIPFEANDAVQQKLQNADNKTNAVEYTEVVKKHVTGKGTDPVGLTLTSTV
uniref:RET cysteine rich domain-containing protein n=1 Tax=Anopheles christyi TaxID=43041 RepID=A0A182K8Z2_9DIPT